MWNPLESVLQFCQHTIQNPWRKNEIYRISDVSYRHIYIYIFIVKAEFNFNSSSKNQTQHLESLKARVSMRKNLPKSLYIFKKFDKVIKWYQRTRTFIIIVFALKFTTKLLFNFTVYQDLKIGFWEPMQFIHRPPYLPEDTCTVD